MSRKLIIAYSLLIYLCLIYLFAWQVNHYNASTFEGADEIQKEAITFYMPAIVFAFYSFLLAGNLYLKKYSKLIIDGLISASVIFLYISTAAIIMASMILLFTFFLVLLLIRKGGLNNNKE